MIRPTPPPVHLRRIEEIFRPGNPGYWLHPEWAARFPWLVQGTTGRSRGDGGEGDCDGEGQGGGRGDFALFTDPPAPGARDSWEGLGELLGDEFGSLPEDIHLHLGPAICGECYEVGSEVHLALGLPEPGEPSPVDLRGHLASRAITAGIGEGRITESAWCTLCEGSPFFSHRRGDGGRQVGFLGIRS